MKKIVFTFLILTFSFRLAAQIDYLEPVRPFSTYKGELGDYYHNVFSFNSSLNISLTLMPLLLQI